MVWGSLYILAAIIAVACAVQLLVKVGIKKTSISFAFGMLGMVLLFLSIGIILITPHTNIGYNSRLFHLADSFLPLAFSILPFLFLLISRNYGRIELANEKSLSVLTRLAALITFVAIFFIISQMLFESGLTDQGYILVFHGILAKAIGVVFGVLLILSLLNFESTRHAASGLTKKQLLVLIIFNLLLITYVVRMFFLGEISSNFFAYLSPAALILTLWLYILMLHRDIYSENVVIDRQAYLSSAIVLFLGIFLVFTGIVAYIINQIGGRADIFLSVLGAFLVIGLFLFVLLSDSIRGRLTDAMKARAYAGRFDYKVEWRQLSEDFAACENINDLLKFITSRIERLLKPSKMAILMVEGKFLVCKYPGECKIESIESSDSLANWIFLKAEPALLSEIDEPSSAALTRLRREFTMIAPIIAEKKLIGIILLAGKDDYSFNPEDFSIMAVISQQAAVTILHLRSRDKLLESEKLASFHKMGSFVVHDLKNAVSMLSLMLQNAPRKMSDPDFQKESIKTIDQAVDRMQKIIEKLKSPPARDEIHVYALDPQNVLSRAIEKSGIANRTDIKLNIADTAMIPVKTDSSVLETVLINLLINAAEAMPEGGEIVIDQQLINNKPRISVRDTGIGMTKPFIDNKLFRPFETTKTKGLGIGLYQCREMFQETGGEIIVNSEPGKGSVFTLIFP